MNISAVLFVIKIPPVILHCEKCFPKISQIKLTMQFNYSNQGLMETFQNTVYLKCMAIINN
jgi:hypothetical protein